MRMRAGRGTCFGGLLFANAGMFRTATVLKTEEHLSQHLLRHFACRA